ncbi:MAG: hypothetical protein Q4E74_01015 [Ruminococcus sp.]|nr:hypothetical protein [Ruminococcus sp.]
MLNLIRMNLYSLFRTVSFWVMIAVTAVIAVFFVYMTNVDIEYMSEENSAAEQTAQQTDENEITVGIAVETLDEWVDQGIEMVSLFQVMGSSAIIALLASIFVAIYTNAEQKTGFIKNIAGQLPKRGMLSLAKLSGIAVELLIMFGVYILATVISGKIILGDKLVLGDVGDLIKIIAVQYLLHLAFCSFVQMLCTVARGAGIGMTVGILFCSGMTSLVYMGINYVVSKLGAEDFDVSKYDLMTYIGSASASDSDMMTKCIIAGAAYLVICTAVSMLVMQKRDIK